MPIAVILIIAFFAGAVLLGTWSVSTTIESRQALARSTRTMAQYGGTNVRQQEMLESIGERVLAPVGSGLLGLARRFTPAGYVESLKRKIVLAGSPPGYEVDRFLVAKVLAVGMVIPWFLLIFFGLGIDGFIGLVVVVLLSTLGFFGPDGILARQIDARREDIERELPDVLDLLVISVEAGLGFEQALDRTTSSVPGPLSQESRRMLQETRMGASRSDALRALDERTQVDDLRSFVLAMLQADNFGISVAKILKSQADEMRIRRRQHAQERAQKAPIKMLFPLVFCIFPAIFVVLLVPALIKVAEAL